MCRRLAWHTTGRTKTEGTSRGRRRTPTPKANTCRRSAPHSRLARGGSLGQFPGIQRAASSTYWSSRATYTKVDRVRDVCDCAKNYHISKEFHQHTVCYFSRDAHATREKSRTHTTLIYCTVSTIRHYLRSATVYTAIADDDHMMRVATVLVFYD